MADAKKAAPLEEPKAQEALPAPIPMEVAALEELHTALELELGSTYSFMFAGTSRSVIGQLMKVHYLGAVIQQDGHASTSFIPWSNVVVVEGA